MLVSILFWQTDRELYQRRPRCQPESPLVLAMAVPEWIFLENLMKTQYSILGMGEIFTHFA